RVCAAQLRQRPLLALDLLGPALQYAAGIPGADVLSRGHRVVLLDDRAALRRESLYAPRRQPFDRDAAGAHRADAGRHLRVLSAAQGRLPRSAELVGAGAPRPDRMGFAPAQGFGCALPQAVAARILAAQLLLGDRERRA